jgi:hypothetical protein
MTANGLPRRAATGTIGAGSKADERAPGTRQAPGGASGDWPEALFDPDSFTTYLDPDRVLLGFPQWGQSKTFGQNTDGDAILSDRPLYPGEALMPAFGVHIAGRRFDSAVDLVEWPHRRARETSSSALVNHYIALHEAATGVRPQVMTWITAQGSQPYHNLKRGSPVGNDLVHALHDFAAFARRIGKEPLVPCLFVNHGQNPTDRYGSAEQYVEAMKQFRRFVSGACRAILGQAEEPVIVMTQVDAGETRDLGAPNFFMRSVFRAQLRLARLDGFVLACNEGHLPVGSDGLHCTSEGYYRQGMAWARAAFGVINRTGWRAPSISGLLWHSPTVLDIEFHVPDRGAIAIVPDGLVAPFEAATPTVAGFQFADARGPILADRFQVGSADPIAKGLAAAVNGRWLRVTFAAPPARTLGWSLGLRRDANGMGRSQVAGLAQHEPLHRLPSGLADRDYALADQGWVPAPG